MAEKNNFGKQKYESEVFLCGKNGIHDILAASSRGGSAARRLDC
ncbi:hypothetical protein [Maridesulfovibrio sp. FT414]